MRRNLQGSICVAAIAVFFAFASLTAHRLAAQQQPSEGRDAPPAESTAGDDKKDAADQDSAQPATTRPAADEPAPRRKVTSTDILKELQRESVNAPRVVAPSNPRAGVHREVVAADALPANAIAPVDPKLLPDGSRLVDRPGRLVREGDGFVYSFESRGQGDIELPMRLLPNRLLEDMEIISENGTRPVVFVVSGEVTEYHGANYLLVQKLLTKTSLGNLR